MRTLALLLSIAVLPACAASPDGAQDDDVLTQMLDHRMQWSRPGHYEYQFTWQQGCFCGPEMTRPIRISVETGQIATAVYVDDHQPVSASILSGLATIEGVFDLIQRGIDQDYDQVTVTYGDQGYPASVFLDIAKKTADEERTITISDVVTGEAP